MTRRRRYLLSAAAGALLMGSIGSAKALIPVFDGSALAQMLIQLSETEKAFALQVTQYTLQAKQYIGEYFGWVTQYQQYVTQLAQAYNESLMLLNFAHHPTLGPAMALLNQSGMGNALPFNPYAAMNLINGSAYAGGGFGSIGGILNSLSGFAGSAYQQNTLYKPTDASWASDQLMHNANTIAAGQGAAMAGYEGFREHMGVLPSLRQTAASADTTKDALDAANQLQSEIAWNINQLGQTQQVATMVQLQQGTRVQRDEERLACELEQFRSSNPAPCPKGDNGAVMGGGGSANGGSENMTVPVPPLLTGVGGNPIGMVPTMPTPPAPQAPPPAYEAPPPAGN